MARVDSGLPMIQLDLIAQSEKKMNLASTHRRLIYSIMCSNCKHILGKLTIKHEPINCPIQYYCSICARNCNHSTLRCPNKEALAYRKPTCLEQFIPGNVLDAYGICSYTPLPEPLYELECAHKSVLEVVDTDRDIRATLIRFGKSEKGKMKDLRLRLSKVADELGRQLVYRKAVA